MLGYTEQIIVGVHFMAMLSDFDSSQSQYHGGHHFSRPSEYVTQKNKMCDPTVAASQREGLDWKGLGYCVIFLRDYQSKLMH